MPLYGVYGSHTTESCPVNNKEIATRVVEFSEKDLSPLLTKYKINEVVAQYHSALEHTLIWVFEAEDPHLIQGFCVESGLASFNKLTIVPLMTFGEGVVPTLKKIHGLQVKLPVANCRVSEQKLKDSGVIAVAVRYFVSKNAKTDKFRENIPSIILECFCRESIA